MTFICFYEIKFHNLVGSETFNLMRTLFLTKQQNYGKMSPNYQQYRNSIYDVMDHVQEETDKDIITKKRFQDLYSVEFCGNLHLCINFSNKISLC